MAPADIAYMICSLFIVFHALDRFNTPRRNRSSTTAFCYQAFSWCYAVIALIIYLLLAKILDSVDVYNTISGIIDHPVQSSSLPYILVLCLTISLRKIPVLSKIDKYIMEKLHTLSGIPCEVERFSKKIFASEFFITDNTNNSINQETIKSLMIHRGFSEEDILFETQCPLKYLLIKIFTTIEHISTLKRDSKHTAFFVEFSNDYYSIENRYSGLERMAKSCFELMKHNRMQTSNRIRSNIDDIIKQFENLSKHLFEDICMLISRNVFTYQLTHEARWNALKNIGFVCEDPGRPVLDPHRLSILIFFIYLTIACLLLAGSKFSSIVYVLKVALTISTVNLIGILAAMFPKQMGWSITRAYDPVSRPWASYLLSGFLGMGVASVFTLFFNTVLNRSLSLAIDEFFGFLSRFQLITFSVAFWTAYHLDNRPKHRKIRLFEASTQAIATMIATYLAYQLLAKAGFPEARMPRLDRFVLGAGFIAFLIGFFIPNWHRRSQPVPADEPLPGRITDNSHTEQGDVRIWRLPLPREFPWWVVALGAGLAAACMTMILQTLPVNSQLRLPVVVGCIVFLLVLLKNPTTRYMRAFWTIFSVFANLNALPAFGFGSIDPAGVSGLFPTELQPFVQAMTTMLAGLLSKGPSWSINAIMGLLMILCLLLDRQERHRRNLQPPGLATAGP